MPPSISPFIIHPFMHVVTCHAFIHSLDMCCLLGDKVVCVPCWLTAKLTQLTTHKGISWCAYHIAIMLACCRRDYSCMEPTHALITGDVSAANEHVCVCVSVCVFYCILTGQHCMHLSCATSVLLAYISQSSPCWLICCEALMQVSAPLCMTFLCLNCFVAFPH